MKLNDKRVVFKRIAAVREILKNEISANARGGKYASGLASEGFAGGYLMALDDVEAALTHGLPSDHRGYWYRATEAMIRKGRTNGNEQD
ncbi:hypothetical protein I6H96_02560 [Brucella anthropi]|uniref:Uncharacterized protein n=1 Tax=Brucella anthropi (strain ATCC 49188 / DSM 6882 / CCUG 24695 / JCM 21032 / LMG 3331 / NBRC 15819 / NCTC 12168 / Alc 37) TaxID=439375 RepID=A6WZ33_BRUA4|nr:hypothetical protein [Brucella anthropi]ABS14237.1 hypothetical protein Oant_1521 [Brucella anthropi ATCC 49188]QQC25763.1 hypothetical protein I6H96_02560 [Brucella anthropi]SUA65513.1 Uncharacterised protein [Brucella anthropi]